MYPIIDRLRWFSAMIVVLGHIRSLLFEPLISISDPNFFHYFFYFVTGFGHQAVIVFFIISGFLVAKPLFQHKLESFQKMTKFYWKRFIRIYPALLFALLFSFICSLITSTDDDKYSFLLNFLNVAELFDKRLIINEPLWSLNYEWLYYVLVPLFFIRFNKKISIFSKLFGFLCSCAIIYYNIKIFLYSIFWIMGALVNGISEKYYKIKYFDYIVIFTMFLSLIFLRFNRGDISIPQFFVNFLFAISFLLLLSKNLYKKIKLSKMEKLLSNSSYSLYILHFPIIIVISSFSDYFNNYLLALFSLLTSIFLSIVSYYLIEKPSLKFK